MGELVIPESLLMPAFVEVAESAENTVDEETVITFGPPTGTR